MNVLKNRRFSTWLGSLRLSARITLVVGVIVLVMLGILSGVLSGRFTRLTREGLSQKARAVATVLATSVAPAIEFEDTRSAEGALSAMTQLPDAMWAAVWREDASLFAAFRGDEVPKSVDTSLKSEPVVTFHSGHLEVAVPIATKSGSKAVFVAAFSTRDLAAAQRGNTVLFAVLALTLLGAGLLASYLIGTWLGRPLNRMAEVALLIAAGDLGAAERALGGREQLSALAAADAGAEEGARLARAFARMLQSLRDMAELLTEAATTLTASVSSLGAAAGAQSDVVARQTEAIGRVASTVGDFRDISSQSARRAHEVLAVADKGELLSRSGGASIDRTLAGLREISSQTHSVANHIVELGELTGRVGSIADAINEIAQESNLLALNASLEAAAAGEAGRGFSVVAAEMRRLADQSASYTKNVRSVLRDMLKAAQQTMTISEQGLSGIRTEVERVGTSGDSLRELAEIVKTSSEAVRSISTAVEHQAEGTADIFNSVSQLTSLTDEMGRAIQATSDAVGSVSTISRRVLEAAQHYRI